MERNIKFPHVVGFIRKSMEDNYDIAIYSEDDYLCIRKEKNGEIIDSFIFTAIFDDEVLKIYLQNRSDYVVETREKTDILYWKLLLEEVREYVDRKIEYQFNTFFNEDNSKPTDINDLDNDDE